MSYVSKFICKLHVLDRRTACAFNPWLPVIMSFIIFVALLCACECIGNPKLRAPFVGTGGAIMACFGIFAIARPVIRVGGYLAWYEKSKSISGGSFKPGPEECQEEREERQDALAVNLVGPALAISGTLINGLSGFLA